MRRPRLLAAITAGGLFNPKANLGLNVEVIVARRRHRRKPSASVSISFSMGAIELKVPSRPANPLARLMARVGGY
jgi:hypothetical protein